MLDWTDLRMVRGLTHTKTFAKVRGNLSREDERKLLRQSKEYQYLMDLRVMGMPALLHVSSRSTGDDKFEFKGTGKLTLDQMEGYVRDVYQVDVAECPLMRVDMASDVEGDYIRWIRGNVRAVGKQCVRGYGRETQVMEVSKRGWESYCWGNKPRQILVYAKTEERRALLMGIRRKMTNEERAALPLEAHFEQEYGYSIFSPVTRFERRLGSGEIEKALGLATFGDLQKAPFVDPFDQLQFPEHVHKGTPGRIPRGLDAFTVRQVRKMVKDDGLTNARDEMIKVWGIRNFYRRWKLIAPLLLDLEEPGLSREDVRKAYSDSTLKQIGTWTPSKLKRYEPLDDYDFSQRQAKSKKLEYKIQQMERQICSA